VDDRIGLLGEHCPGDRIRIEQVELERLGAQRTQALGASSRLVCTDHLVPGIDQLGDEASADGAARACN